MQYTFLHRSRHSTIGDFIKHKTRLHIPSRGGVIPFIVVEGVKYYCLGVDTEHGDYTDFGGGIRKVDLAVINGALREFKEESLGVFQDKVELVDDTIVYNHNMCILFLDYTTLSILPEEYVRKFERELVMRKAKGERIEVSLLEWFDEANFQALIDGSLTGKTMYTRVQNLLRPIFRLPEGNPNFASKIFVKPDTE